MAANRALCSWSVGAHLTLELSSVSLKVSVLGYFWKCCLTKLQINIKKGVVALKLLTCLKPSMLSLRFAFVVQ